MVPIALTEQFDFRPGYKLFAPEPCTEALRTAYSTKEDGTGAGL